jgi:SAM-dependent methyltransferase
LWDKEFFLGKWNFIDHTTGDCVYPILEKYAHKGSILDLGCGPGNTATELSLDAYSSYVGIDISEEALAKATKRTESSGRTVKNRFAQADFLSYEPAEQFDVILFRESMYHVPVGKIRSILDKYSNHLKNRGVFIVRMYTSVNGKPKYRPTRMVNMITTNYDVVEKSQYRESGAAVIVFRPRRTTVKGLRHLEGQQSR